MVVTEEDYENLCINCAKHNKCHQTYIDFEKVAVCKQEMVDFGKMLQHDIDILWYYGEKR